MFATKHIRINIQSSSGQLSNTGTNSKALLKPFTVGKLSSFISKKGLRVAQRKKTLYGFYAIKYKKWLITKKFTQFFIRKLAWWRKKRINHKINTINWVQRKGLKKRWATKFHKKLPPFFRSLFFRFKWSYINKVYETKAYKYAILQQRALDLAKNYLKASTVKPVQPRRSTRRFSFFKAKYLLRNFIWDKYFGGVQWNKFYKKKISTTGVGSLINFANAHEMQLIALVLRTNLVKTAATANQFIKHGFVYVNFEKALKPYTKINEGDIITLDINAAQHAFFEQLQGYKKQFWLDKEQQNIVYHENLSHTTRRYKNPKFYNRFHIRNAMKITIKEDRIKTRNYMYKPQKKNKT